VIALFAQWNAPALGFTSFWHGAPVAYSDIFEQAEGASSALDDLSNTSEWLD